MSLLQEPDWGRGWGVYLIACPACEHTLSWVAAVGSVEYNCSACGYEDKSFVWHGPGNEVPGDGLALVPVDEKGARHDRR